MKTHHISSAHLSVAEAYNIVHEGYTLALSDEARQRIQACREYLDNKIAASEVPIYGVTTGFGSLCQVSINAEQLSQLQINLMMSHACGIGPRVRNEIVRLMLLLKIQSLSYGYSGCQVQTVQRLIDFFNHGVCPVVYEQGSVGASGDLVPLAHLCLPLVGMGEVEYQGEVISGAELNTKMGWEPIQLASKEGLALLNGTQNMSAHAVWSVAQAQRLSSWADVIGTLSLEAYDGRRDPFTIAVHTVRPHKGQTETAERINKLLEGSQLIEQHKVNVQDPYSFRCMPQVHGTVKDTLRYVESVIETEINSATDNPTVVPEEDVIISAGNFHGEPVALPMDFLAIALSELGAISERRTYKLVGGTRGLPSFLVAHPGLNSGFMIPQYTAAAIASQNKTLCMPSSADTIPTSQGQEDHVSMGANAATKLVNVVENTQRILGIELLNAAQALHFRRPLKTSPALEHLCSEYRKSVPFIENDEVMYPHIAQSVDFLNRFDPQSL